MSFRILLIGAGNLGARHLQSLAHCSLGLEICVVDPSPEALLTTKKLWEEHRGKHLCSFHSSIPSDGDRADLAIVATNSLPRARIIMELLGRGVQLLILEKFLFPTLADYQTVEEALDEKGARAWVNCPRRLYPGLTQLRKLLDGLPPRRYSVTGVNWGLACNSVHFLDHWAALLPNRVPIDFVLPELEPRIYPSKRVGYIEFCGTLKAQSGNAIFTASCIQTESHPVEIQWEIETARGELIQIDERAALMTCGGNSYPYPVPLQSELTSGVVENLLERDCCALTTYKESSIYHQAILRTFLGHMTEIEGRDCTLCLIT